MVTIHNNPENLEVPASFQQLRFQLADVDTQDCSPFFAPTFSFIEEGRAVGEGALAPFSASRSCNWVSGRAP